MLFRAERLIKRKVPWLKIAALDKERFQIKAADVGLEIELAMLIFLQYLFSESLELIIKSK